MPELDMSAVPTSASEADALVSAIESPEGATQDTTQEVDPQASEQPKTAAEKRYELIRKGVKREFTPEEMIPFAQKGWDYEEKMREFHQNRATLLAQERQNWEKQFDATKHPKFQELEKQLSRYREVDDYIKRDPQWWNTVQEAYQQRLQEQGTATPTAHPVIDQLQKQVETLSQFVNSQQERERLEQEKARFVEEATKDAELDNQVAEYREKYSHFDWNSRDESGLDLENRILQHAITNKIGSFRAAANDYLHDEHLKRHEVSVKEQTGKEIKKQTKLGLGPVTDKPSREIKRISNVRSKSYDDITQDALDELGVG